MQLNTSFLKSAVVAAALVLGTTAAKADTMTFTGSVEGAFNGGTASMSTGVTASGSTSTTPTLSYYGSTFNGTTSFSPALNTNILSLGGGGTSGPGNTNNFGSLLLSSTVGDYNNVPFELFVTFTAPTGISSGQNSTFNANIFGSVSSDPNNAGGIQLAFMPASQTYTFANGTQSGTFTLNLNNVAVNPGKVASITGYITESSVAATPEPNSLMLLGTGFVSAAGMLMRRRKLAA